MSDSTRNPADYARMVPAQPSTVADFLPSPRPIGITSQIVGGMPMIYVLYDNGTVFRYQEAGMRWVQLSSIPTGDRP